MAVLFFFSTPGKAFMLDCPKQRKIQKFVSCENALAFINSTAVSVSSRVVVFMMVRCGSSNVRESLRSSFHADSQPLQWLFFRVEKSRAKVSGSSPIYHRATNDV